MIVCDIGVFLDRRSFSKYLAFYCIYFAELEAS